MIWGLSWLVLVAALALAAWVWLLLLHGRFWLADQRLPASTPAPARWPAVVAVVPARNEADVIGQAIAGHLAQDYPGAFRVILVDDESTDGTAAVARAAAGERAARLTILRAPPREPTISSNPQRVVAIDQQPPHIHVGQAVARTKPLEFVTVRIELMQAVDRTDPYGAVARLRETRDDAAAQCAGVIGVRAKSCDHA